MMSSPVFLLAVGDRHFTDFYLKCPTILRHARTIPPIPIVKILYQLLQHVKPLTFTHILLFKNKHKFEGVGLFFILVHTNIFYLKFMSTKMYPSSRVYMSITCLWHRLMPNA